MPQKVKRFQKQVLQYWRHHGRHTLPWRHTKDPYRILVSEVMLQQTQVSRVIEKYKEFLKQFPTVRALAKASLSDVLKVWNGLGYNRRGKYLHDAAKEIVAIGNMKEALGGPLPGVGPYTRAAVRVFAFNEPLTMIETNIRAAFIHHFASGFTGSALRSLGEAGSIHDKQILPLAQKAAEGQDPREWHWALMDYGAHLKRSGVRNNSRSAHYTRQSKFEGSLRQVRGAIVRALHHGPRTPGSLIMDLRNPYIRNVRLTRSNIEKALTGLARDGLIVKEKGKWRVA